jgi:hypothetical protein
MKVIPFSLHLIPVPHISSHIKSNKIDNTDKIIIARIEILVTLWYYAKSQKIYVLR